MLKRRAPSDGAEMRVNLLPGALTSSLPGSTRCFRPVDLVTGLLKHLQRVVAGAQMSATQGLESHETYLFVCFFSMSLPCRLRVGQGGGGPPPPGGALRPRSKLQKGTGGNSRAGLKRLFTQLQSRWVCHLDDAHVDKQTPASTCKRERPRSPRRCPLGVDPEC